MNQKSLLPFLAPALISITLAATLAMAAPADAWLHVKIDNSEGNRERVRVNVPLSLAEKVLPAIQVNKMHHGKLEIGHRNVSVDPRALVEAVRSVQDGVFVTVESDRENVSVAKEKGFLLVKVKQSSTPAKDAKKDAKDDQDSKDSDHRRHHPENVEIRLPMDVVEALLSGSRDELDILAAIKALAAHKDLALVSVTDKSQTVRVWIDNKNTSE